MESDVTGTVDSNNINHEKKWSWEGSQKDRMKNLLETGFNSDLTILVGLKKVAFKVHRLVLLSQSEKFYEIVEKLTPGNDLEIVNYDPEVFEMFLRHLYVGDSGAGIEEALPLHKIASDYQVEDLVTRCSNLLKGDLNDRNVTVIYQQAMELGQKELIKTSLDYICKNGWKILELKEFLDLRLECFYEILKSDDFKARSELQVLEAVIKWTEAQCKLQNLPLTPNDVANENMRKVMNKLLWLIRFPVMDQAELNINPVAKRIKSMLTNEEHFTLLHFFSVAISDRAQMGSDIFNPVPRKYYDGGKLYEVDRFLQPRIPAKIIQTMLKNELLEISVDKEIMLKGMKFLEETFKISGEDHCDWGQVEAMVLVKHVDYGTTLYQEKKMGDCILMERIEFKRPIKFEALQWYSIDIKFVGPVYVFKSASCLYDRCDEMKYRLKVCTKFVAGRELIIEKEEGTTESINFSFRRTDDERTKSGDLPLEQGFISGLTFQLY